MPYIYEHLKPELPWWSQNPGPNIRILKSIQASLLGPNAPSSALPTEAIDLTAKSVIELQESEQAR